MEAEQNPQSSHVFELEFCSILLVYSSSLCFLSAL